LRYQLWSISEYMPLNGRNERIVYLVLALVSRIRIAVLKNVAKKTEMKIA
jgi:hypothetical protein